MPIQRKQNYWFAPRRQGAQAHEDDEGRGKRGRNLDRHVQNRKRGERRDNSCASPVNRGGGGWQKARGGGEGRSQGKKGDPRREKRQAGNNATV